MKSRISVLILKRSQSGGELVDPVELHRQSYMGKLLCILWVFVLSPHSQRANVVFLHAICAHQPDGRRPVLLLSMTGMAVGSIWAGAAPTIPHLLAGRIVQAFGASSGLSVGIGVLADIFKMEERGSASGVFFGVLHSLLLSFSAHKAHNLFTGNPSGHVSCPNGRGYHRTLLLVACNAIRTVLRGRPDVRAHILFPARDVSPGDARGGEAGARRGKSKMGVAESICEHRTAEESKRALDREFSRASVTSCHWQVS